MNTDQKYHKKTILQVLPTLVSGGVERGTLEIAQKIVNSGYRSIVISAGGPLVESLEKSGSKHIYLNVASKNPFIILLNSIKIAKIIKQEKVDIIHARSRAPAWSCLIAAKKTRIKLVTTFHGIYNFHSRIKKLYNSIMTKGDVVIAVSLFVKEHIIKNYNLKNNKITVIYRGVNHNDFNMNRITEENLQKYRTKYNVPQNVPVILLPARMTKWKGHMLLAQALETIKDSDFFCIMAGDLSKHPTYVNSIKSFVNENKMQNKIQLFGNEPDMKNLYAISDIVISASVEPEAFGRTIIEAQSMEKLVIATNSGGASETIQDGITGFHVEPENIEELSEKIKHCLSIIGTKEQNKITSAARISVIKNFSIDLMLDKVMSVYNSL